MIMNIITIAINTLTIIIVIEVREMFEPVVRCEKCDGTGKVWKIRVCPLCEGTGYHHFLKEC